MGDTLLDSRPLVPAGMEVKAATAAADAKASASVLVGHEESTGVVEAFVSITGVVDEVNDVIVPGAYRDTLVKRKPKGVFSHDWNRWVARTEEIEEWLPGDARIAEKMADAGKPMLPAGAGVLYVKTRFNLKTDEGRNAYENVVFFSETGECEWSIGYLVPPGKSATDKAGVRHIKSLDLYEYSPVLFGAAPLSTSLSVKSLSFGKSATGGKAIPTSPLSDVLAALGRKNAQQVEDEDAALDALHEQADREIDWDEVDAATAALESKYLALAEKAGTPGVADTPKDAGNAENLRRWYVAGEGAAKIKWGTEGDLTRCHKIAAKHMSPDRAWGYCNLRHRDATGKFNGKSDEGKSLPAVEPASALLTGYDPAAEVKTADRAIRPQDETPPAGGTPVDDQVADEHDTLNGTDDDAVMESKEFPYLSGSYEERNAAIRRAVEEALRGDALPDDADEDDGPARPVPAGRRHEWDYVEIVATFPDRVIARRNRWEHMGDSAQETYEVEYRFDGDQCLLGQPEEVTLEVTTTIVGAAGQTALPDVPDSVYAGVDAVSVGIKALADSMQTKAGRVLSAANEVRLRQAVEHLVHVLRAAGVPINPVGADAQGRSDAATVDTTVPAGHAPAAVEGKALPNNGGGTPEGIVVMPPHVAAAGLLSFLDSLDDED